MNNREWCEEHGENYNELNEESVELQKDIIETVPLKRCPCGQIPDELFIYDIGQGGKWAMTYGSCCGEWHIEFRTNYHDQKSNECMLLAITSWNDAPRGGGG